MPHPIYSYKPIDLDKTAIRLVHLHAGQYDSPVYCEIEEVLLGDQGVPYHALSYTWGLNAFQESINVVDPLDATIQVVHITKSLFSALKHLRDPVRSTWLWADGVCIDQNNPKERAHQVSQMRQVYSGAERIIIWLGDFASDDPDDTTASDIDVLMRYARRLDKKVVSGQAPSLGSKSWEDQLFREGANAWSVAKMTSAMQTLLRNPWFRRVWIIQEVVSARSALVVCGENGYANSISTRTFVLLPSLLGIKPDVQSQSILDVMPLMRGKRRGDWIHGVHLQTLLVKFHNSQCSEPRDFVFALLGMAADGRSIAPNYEVREEVIFANVLSYFLFGKVMETECQLPGNKDVMIKALTDPCGPRHHVLMWALTYGHRATAMRLLELADERIEAERIVKASPPEPSSNTITAEIRPASKSLNPKKVPLIEKNKWSTALHLATAQGDIHFVRRILSRPGVNINAKNDAGDTPLSIAVIRRDTDMVRFLLAREKGKNIDVNIANNRGETPLSIIVARRDRILARVLLAHKDVNINTGDTGCDPLARAVAGSDWAMTQLLLQHGVDHYPISKKPSPLMTAVSNNNTTAVRVLLRHSHAGRPGRSNKGQNQRSEVLAAAIHRGNEEIARLLLAHRDAPDLSTTEATKLWIQANSNGHERIADLLVEYQTPVDMSSEEAGGTRALMNAVRLDQITTIDRLLALGADVNKENSFSSYPTPLIQAIESHNVDMTRKLIHRGADVNFKHRTFHYFSPLCYAASRGNLEILDLLLQCEQIDIHAVHHSMWSEGQGRVSVGALALQASVACGYKQIFERLWEHELLDVDVNGNRYGQWCANEPLLTVAAGRGHLSIAQMIVDGARGKVDLNRTDFAEVYTPLKKAARQGQTLFAQWLLQIGGNEIDVEFGKDREDGTALWSAVETLSYEIAEMLLQRGAKTDVECYGSTDDHGPEYKTTPLWRAAYKGSVRMVELLLSGGANIYIKGRAKRQSLHNAAMSRPHSPLTQAAYGGHADIVRLLVKHGAEPAEVGEIDDAELQCKLRGFIQRAVEDETVLSFHRVLSPGLTKGGT